MTRASTPKRPLRRLDLGCFTGREALALIIWMSEIRGTTVWRFHRLWFVEGRTKLPGAEVTRLPRRAITAWHGRYWCDRLRADVFHLWPDRVFRAECSDYAYRRYAVWILLHANRTPVLSRRRCQIVENMVTEIAHSEIAAWILALKRRFERWQRGAL